MSAKNEQAYRAKENNYLQSNGLSSKDHFIDVEQSDLNVRVQTIGKGKPLLFIHGSVNAGSTWSDLLAHIPNRKCMLLDRPGCALSDDIRYKDYDHNDLDLLIFNTLNSVLAYFNLDSVDIVGSSFGGFWTVKFANRYPKKVDKVVLEGCPAMVEGMNVPGFMKMMVHPIMSYIIPLLPTTKGFAKKTMKDMGHDYSVENEIFKEALYDWYLALLNKTKTMSNEIANLKLLFHKGQMKPEYILRDELFSNLQCQTLILWGENDAFADQHIADRLLSKLKNGQLHSYPKHGHLPWLDDPEAHAKEILAFLSN